MEKLNPAAFCHKESMTNAGLNKADGSPESWAKMTGSSYFTMSGEIDCLRLAGDLHFPTVPW